MTGRIPVVHYVLIALLAIPTIAYSTEEELINDWAVVMAVKPGEKLFVKLKDDKKVTSEVYRDLYKKAGGNFFRSKRHLNLYVKEHDLLTKTK